MSPESFPGSALGRALCVLVLLILAIAAGYAVALGLANYQAIMV